VSLFLLTRSSTHTGRAWVIYHNKVYDLSDYFATVTYYATSSGEGIPNYNFLPSSITDLVKNQAGQDLTKELDEAFAALPADNVTMTKTCLDNAFFVGVTDFRLTARCTVQNYLLLSFSILLMSTIGLKCEWLCFLVASSLRF
jgi:chitin synthase